MRKLNFIFIAVIALLAASCGSKTSQETTSENIFASVNLADTSAVISLIDKQVATILAYTEAGEPRIVDTGKEGEYHEKLLNNYYYNADNNIIRIKNGGEGGSDFYISGGKLIYINNETEAGSEVYYFVDEKLFCEMNDYIGDGTMKPLPGNTEDETALLNAYKLTLKMEKESRTSASEDESDADMLDETLLLTEDQLMPQGSYDVNDFDFERFGKFDNAKILSQLWTSNEEQYLKKGKVSVYLYPERLTNFEEVVLYVSITHEIEDQDNSLWYVVYDKNNKVISYACLSQYKQEANSLRNGKFITKDTFIGNFEEGEIKEKFILTFSDNGQIVEELVEDETEEISLYPETQNKFEAAGIDDDKTVYELIQKLKDCGSRDELMRYIDFPITMNGKQTEKSNFPKDCDKILTFFALVNFDENSASSNGVMLGNGEIYINSINNKLKITTINIE